MDERPLIREPALEPLLILLRVGARRCPLDEETAVQLLCSPLGGADALDVRRLRRALHGAERAGGGSRRSGELLVECLQAESLDPLSSAALPDDVAAAPRRITGLLQIVNDAVAAGQTPEQVLWAVWSASRWRDELQKTVAHPGGASPALLRHADRQLDAVVAIFEAAARFSDRLPASGLEIFLEGLLAQEIPADPLSQRSFRGDAVRVAHGTPFQGPGVGSRGRPRGTGATRFAPQANSINLIGSVGQLMSKLGNLRVGGMLRHLQSRPSQTDRPDSKSSHFLHKTAMRKSAPDK